MLNHSNVFKYVKYAGFQTKKQREREREKKRKSEQSTWETQARWEDNSKINLR